MVKYLLQFVGNQQAGSQYVYTQFFPGNIFFIQDVSKNMRLFVLLPVPWPFRVHNNDNSTPVNV